MQITEQGPVTFYSPLLFLLEEESFSVLKGKFKDLFLRKSSWSEEIRIVDSKHDGCCR